MVKIVWLFFNLLLSQDTLHCSKQMRRQLLLIRSTHFNPHNASGFSLCATVEHYVQTQRHLKQHALSVIAQNPVLNGTVRFQPLKPLPFVLSGRANGEWGENLGSITTRSALFYSLSQNLRSLWCHGGRVDKVWQGSKHNRYTNTFVLSQWVVVPDCEWLEMVAQDLRLSLASNWWDLFICLEAKRCSLRV